MHYYENDFINTWRHRRTIKINRQGLTVTIHINKLSLSKLSVAVLAAAAASSQSYARGPDLPVELLGGSFTLDGIVKNSSGTAGQGRELDGGNSLFLDLGLTGLGFAGEMTVNAMTKSSDSDIYFKYGDRLTARDYPNGGKEIEVYSFTASHIGEQYDLNLFYHVPRYHWGYEGDSFGLMRETTNMADQDTWNAKAPAGAEFVGKGSLEGLKIVAGKQIYWGAEPMVMAKYQFGEKGQYAFLASSDVTDGVNEQQFSLQGDFDLDDTSTLRLGLLRSGYEKVGQTYLYDDGVNIYSDSVDSSDAYAIKARVTEKFSGGVSAYAEYNHAGLVADAGEHQEIWTTGLPYSELGNKKTIELGAELIDGNWMFKPRLFSRRNLVDALSPAAQSSIGKRVTRNITTTETIVVSPFSVTDNREVDSVELFATYDTTPGTYFYEWDNYLREDAPVAFNVGVTHSEFKGKSDSSIMNFDTGAFPDAGRTAEKVTKLEGRIVVNPTDVIRLNMNFAVGKQQPVFSDQEVTNFASIAGTVVHESKHVYSFMLARDAYGEYDFQEEQGVSYPLQVMLGYEHVLDLGDGDTRVGVKGVRRTYESGSSLDSESEVRAYFTYSF